MENAQLVRPKGGLRFSTSGSVEKRAHCLLDGEMERPGLTSFYDVKCHVHQLDHSNHGLLPHNRIAV